jgi:hypothetical protein
MYYFVVKATIGYVHFCTLSILSVPVRTSGMDLSYRFLNLPWAGSVSFGSKSIIFLECFKAMSMDAQG